MAYTWPAMSTDTRHRQYNDATLPEPTPEPAPRWQPAVGEPVRLKSGDWPMVVGKVETDIDRITTVWMDAQGQPQQASYPAACLVSAKEGQP
jgi:hypothetical protein